MGEKNNFDIIRLVLASVVMLVHTAQVTRNDDIHFFSELLNSDFAVKGFFAISGFLIAKSYLRSSSLKSYFIKEGANKQVISSQADSLIKISRIWADFFPANTSNQPI